MAEYIDGEALLKAVYEIGGHPWSDWETAGVVSLICKQPAADVVEVKRGRWETEKAMVFNGEFEAYRHSHNDPKCKFSYVNTELGGHNFCPNCGADMREVDPCTE